VKSKKGISPLIATVLLIGFTIVLAALVMRWGGQFFRQQTDVVGCESEGQIQCTSGVDLVIDDVNGTTGTAGNLRIAVLNNGNQDVDKIQYIVIDEMSTTNQSVPDEDGAVGLGGDSHTFTSLAGLKVSRVKIIPILDYEMRDGSTSCTVYCSEETKNVDITVV